MSKMNFVKLVKSLVYELNVCDGGKTDYVFRIDLYKMTMRCVNDDTYMDMSGIFKTAVMEMHEKENVFTKIYKN